ncbi:NADH pyrophosphatase [Sphingorhabdus lutea]|uniref:NAD(+) diphosphatase n=1 Tax=Sphingorhabdus lutea TaxID=1913578 RepID=A0A1L3JAX0_9SPHN|nr:NAD(+) diphosphatase [Sphingorhabdus lutea]APG62280.1 NADH pyrophosphatase [Sphingorhabdus lutea]
MTEIISLNANWPKELPLPGFTGEIFDRADQIRVSEEKLRVAMMRPNARLLKMQGLDPVIGDDGALSWTSFAYLPDNAVPLFLGLDGDVPLFAAIEKVEAAPYPNPRLWQVIAHLSAKDAAIYASTRSVIDWHNRHQFCAVCGGQSHVIKCGWARKCGGCGAEHFPRVDPVTIMLAEHDGHILLGRQPRFPPKRYSALAGFVEPGESLEGAVAREMFEEAGVRLHSIQYVASQPWPFPSSLMMGFIGQADSREIVLDVEELEDAIWVSEAEVRAAMNGDENAPFIAPPPLAIAHSLLSYWLHIRGKG